MAHEIFHAVQVQEWDTAKLLDSKTLPTDRLLAHQALLEGDATIVMMQYMIGGLNQGEEMLSATLDQTKYGMLRQLGMSAKLAVFTGGSANFANAPRYVKRSLVMPYVMGAEFIWSLRKEANMTWSDINDIYKKPPSTTEHILLPETFWKRREPATTPPPLPKAPVTWAQTDDDVFGLFMISEAIERNESHDKPPLGYRAGLVIRLPCLKRVPKRHSCLIQYGIVQLRHRHLQNSGVNVIRLSTVSRS